MIDDSIKDVQREETGQTDYVDLVMSYLIYWPWMLVGVVVSLVCAFFMLKHITPMYQTSASMLIKSESSEANKYSGAADALGLGGMGVISMANDFDTELKVLSSRNLVQHVVESLDLYVDLREKTPLANKDIYGNSPVKVWTSPGEAAKMGSAKFTIDLNDNGAGKISLVVGPKEEEQEIEREFTKLPIVLPTKLGVVSVTRVDSVKMRNMTIRGNITSPEMATKGFLARLTIEPLEKNTYVASIVLNDPSKLRAKNFINRLADLYNEDANTDKNIVAQKTSDFINNRILLISKELGQTENEMSGFKKKAGLTDVTSDVQASLKGRQEYEKLRSDNETQLRLISYIKSFINEAANQNEVIPLNTTVNGQDDGGLTKLISSYNDLVMNRMRLIRNSTENSTVIRDLDVQINGMRNSIISTIASIERSAHITQSKLDAEASRYAGQIVAVPDDEKQFLSISRQREFQSQLYLVLLQKREENAIKLAATADNGKLIESPVFIAKVSPKGSIFYLVALILGIAIPCCIIYLKRMFSFCIESRADVKAITSIPIIGEIPFEKSIKGERSILIKENSNGLFEEVYRNLRTNMQFLLKDDQKVILVTSTTSGEGKSTTASNLAMSYAFLGKKVVVVGLDVRKPGLNKVFHLPIHNTTGITAYLSNPEQTDIMSLLQKSNECDNLYVLVAGTIPPNPTELVARPALDEAVKTLRQHFDIVILDTAPMGMMADTALIARTADVSVYVCRENYTRKASFSLINEAREHNKLPNIGIVLNGIDMNSRSSGYNYGYGKYGYYNRYGYGYGKDYGEGYANYDHSKKPTLGERLLGWIARKG